MTYALGGSYCRVLSGQKRPELSMDEGCKLAADCIETCLPYAQERDITLIIENHYKDDFWEYPEFAQKMDVFCKLVDRIHHPYFRRELRSKQHLLGRGGSAGVVETCFSSCCHYACERQISFIMVRWKICGTKKAAPPDMRNA